MKRVLAIICLWPAIAAAGDYFDALEWSADAKNLGRAYMSFDLLRRCYLGSLRNVNKDTFGRYAFALGRIEAETARHNPELDRTLIERDALVAPFGSNRVRDPSAEFCTMARIQFSYAYWSRFDWRKAKRFEVVSNQCFTLGVCSAWDIHDIKPLLMENQP